ncbi:head decoration protein [Geovibrio ferrireducens]|uniref:head decoration protein n=1 Tax=Geovibrio ferrireducens TaxID=46201 RepID=UPI002246D339|nr:head decoration protein [Geovibrio ferrireducens]
MSQFIPDNLIAGTFPRQTAGIVLASGSALKRGALLGKDTDGKFKLSLAAAEDGSEDPVAILAEDVDATAGDKVTIAYTTGEFASDELTYGPGHTAESVKDALHIRSIFIKEMF